LVVIQKLQSLVENSSSIILVLWSLLLCYFSGTKKSTRTDWQNHTVATSDLTQKRTVENWGVTMWIQLP
jgi:hypothetical protein